MKMLKKLMALTLCVMLVSSAMVFTAFADDEVVFAEYHFESFSTGSSAQSVFSVGGGASSSDRSVVEGTNPDGTNGKQVKITIRENIEKHKFMNMFDNDRFGVDGVYTLSVYVKLAEDSSTDSNEAFIELFENGVVGGFESTKDAPATITKDEWVLMTYDYCYNPGDNVVDSFCVRINDEVVEGQEPIILLDDAKVIEKKAATHTFDDIDYNYTQVALQSFATNSKNFFYNASTKHSVSTAYNYPNSTGEYGALFSSLASGNKYRVRSGSDSTGIISVDDLVVGTKYRYSVMAKLGADATVESAELLLGLHADTSKANPSTGKTVAATIYKDVWTKICFVDTPTSTSKATSMAVQNTSSTALPVMLDDFKIEEMTPAVPLETSFAFGEETATSLEEAGDYTANVKFGKNFADDNATVAFVKYVDGMVAEKEVITQADLTNGAEKTFTITADELETAQLSVFVWNNINDLFPLIKGLTIAK